MLDRYGRAVVEERTKPQGLTELARYLRMEYGLGTEPAAFIAQENHRSARKKGRILGRAASALGRAARALIPSNGRKTEADPPHPTR
jgi:hypothetical protein